VHYTSFSVRLRKALGDVFEELKVKLELCVCVMYVCMYVMYVCMYVCMYVWKLNNNHGLIL